MIDSLLHIGVHHPFSPETLHIRLLVAGDDDSLRPFNLLPGRHIFRANGAVGLHLDFRAKFPGRLLQSLSRQICMGHAHGTARHPDQKLSRAAARCASLLFREGRQNLLRFCRALNALQAGIIQQSRRDAAEQGNVDIIRLIRHRDQKNDPAGRAFSAEPDPPGRCSDCHGGP